MKRRECGAQSRVRSPTAARRRGLPTGAARRRARIATLIEVSWPPGGEDSEGRRLGVPARLASRDRGDRPRDGGDRTPGSDRPSRPPTTPRARPAILSAFVLYGLLSLAIHAPRVHPDELRYLLAASSLVEGEGLTLRGQGYGFGPLLSLMLAAIILVAGSIDAAYDWFKIAEALVFALTAVPVYLLARRIVTPWWAVLAAALAVAIPSSVSVATIMTESVSFLTTAWALYAIAVALERPTVLRQFLVLGAIGFAVLARTQFGILYVTWVVALGLLWLLAPWSRPRTRTDVYGLWPTVLPVILAPLAFAARLASGDSASSTFGAYWSLWRGYDPFQVVKWLVYHLADFTIYLAVVPVAVAPIVLWKLGRAGREGGRNAGAFVALFSAANVTGLLVVAAFASTPWGYDRLHDRYAFYLVPLWLVGFVVWLAAGLPRPVVASVIGAAIALVLPLVLPFAQLANDAGIDTVPGALWLRIESALAGHGHLSARLVLLLFVLALLAGTSSSHAGLPSWRCRSRWRGRSPRCRGSRGSGSSRRPRTRSSRAASTVRGSTTGSRKTRP